jgi:hypothetical protein
MTRDPSECNAQRAAITTIRGASTMPFPMHCHCHCTLYIKHYKQIADCGLQYAAPLAAGSTQHAARSTQTHPAGPRWSRPAGGRGGRARRTRARCFFAVLCSYFICIYSIYTTHKTPDTGCSPPPARKHPSAIRRRSALRGTWQWRKRYVAEPASVFGGRWHQK